MLAWLSEMQSCKRFTERLDVQEIYFRGNASEKKMEMELEEGWRAVGSSAGLTPVEKKRDQGRNRKGEVRKKGKRSALSCSTVLRKWQSQQGVASRTEEPPSLRRGPALVSCHATSLWGQIVERSR